MPQLNLADTFRYLTAGLLGLLYLLVYDSLKAKNIVDAVGVMGLFGATLASGVLFYVVYRALLYNTLIVSLQDRVRRVTKTDSYRTWLMHRFDITQRDAVRLYIAIRDAEFKEQYTSAAVPAAHVHYAYIGGLLAFPFALLSYLSGRHDNLAGFGVTGVVVFISAFLYDRRFEDEELMLLLNVGEDKIDVAAKRLLNAEPRAPNA